MAMDGLRVLQVGAMSMIVLGGLFLAHHMWQRPHAPLRPRAIVFYLAGSLAWAAYAALCANHFLLVSASVNVLIYVSSLYNLRRARRARIPESHLSDSETSLPSLPPPHRPEDAPASR